MQHHAGRGHDPEAEPAAVGQGKATVGVRIVVSRSAVEAGAIEGVLAELLDVASSASEIVAHERSVSLEWPAGINQETCSRFLMRLHVVWPLWVHFLTPASLVTVVRTLVVQGADDERVAIDEFLHASTQAVAELYRIYGIARDPEQLRRAAAADIAAAGIPGPVATIG